MNNLKQIFPTFRRIVGAPKFLWVLIALFIIQALWIALTGRYPMAFDEEVHIGTIKLYADHISPFWSAHPAGADSFGAITRDPSYLYHYVMSFPYRIIRLFTDSLAIQVLIMRFINIAIFASALPLYQRLLLKFRASRVTVHVALLMFIFVPIVPLLAAQVNYDNVIVPLTALSFLLTLKVLDHIAHKKLNAIAVLQLLVILAISSLVKYAFLPIVIGILLCICVQFWRAKFGFRAIAREAGRSFRTASPQKWLLVGMLVLMSVLFVERYGINLVRYHAPVADCAQVLSYDHCQHYGPWIRDYNAAQTKSSDAETSPIAYTQHWFYGMWFRSFFAVDGPITGFQTRSPLLIPAISAIVLAIASGLALLYSARYLLRTYNKTALWLFSVSTVVYVAVLWHTEYSLFLETGNAVAINGRYLILLLPGIFVIAALALKHALRRVPHGVSLLGIAAIVSFAWGGGALTYIIRSNDAWYWPNTPMTAANHMVQRVVTPVTPGAGTADLFKQR